MKAVVQRVNSATLRVDGKVISHVEKGFVVYFGVAKNDVLEKADFLAKKIAKLRVFEDENGKMNLDLAQVGGQVLVVSQFTLLADVDHGNRPSFTNAEVPQIANETYEYFKQKLGEYDIVVKGGVFGADMKIEQHNDGPVTIIYDV